MNGDEYQLLQQIAGHLRLVAEQMSAAKSQLILAEEKLQALLRVIPRTS